MSSAVEVSCAEGQNVILPKACGTDAFRRVVMEWKLFRVVMPALMLAVVTACSTVPSATPAGEGLWRNDLNDDVVARVVRNATGEQVEAILGKPHQRMRFDNLEATAWDYRYKDTWGYWVDLSVMVNDNNRVMYVIRQRIENSRDD
jgi:outer membrane protein assembly factor BamE (lipoprotein component of BamABCDE complex)